MKFGHFLDIIFVFHSTLLKYIILNFFAQLSTSNQVATHYRHYTTSGWGNDRRIIINAVILMLGEIFYLMLSKRLLILLKGSPPEHLEISILYYLLIICLYSQI
jgi:hypothetical protein